MQVTFFVSAFLGLKLLSLFTRSGTMGAFAPPSEYKYMENAKQCTWWIG
jgi:hypothetical protein